ncbi:MAG TPA: hypothetical protein VMX18_02115 [Candidatus Bipolaricaulota bacterium]|nr:hypothetical protein [Candidatus Bipolaricaulota bacterium]
MIETINEGGVCAMDTEVERVTGDLAVIIRTLQGVENRFNGLCDAKTCSQVPPEFSAEKARLQKLLGALGDLDGLKTCLMKALNLLEDKQVQLADVFKFWEELEMDGTLAVVVSGSTAPEPMELQTDNPEPPAVEEAATKAEPEDVFPDWSWMHEFDARKWLDSLSREMAVAMAAFFLDEDDVWTTETLHSALQDRYDDKSANPFGLTPSKSAILVVFQKQGKVKNGALFSREGAGMSGMRLTEIGKQACRLAIQKKRIELATNKDA